MQVDLRMPNITGTDREQLSQIRSYLYQFIPQLQWALNSIDTSSASNYVVQNTKTNTASQQASNSEVAFDDLKALIIKTADTVEAYYEEITKTLEGSYVAKSDFGTYTEETELKITENSKGVTSYYESKKQIDTDIDNLEASIKETKGYIKTGVLDQDDDGHDILGVEILQGDYDDGEEQGKRLARFTSDRLSFYDQNGYEVAYISGYKLYITNAEFTGNVTFGAFLVDTSKGFSLKWVGRG